MPHSAITAAQSPTAHWTLFVAGTTPIHQEFFNRVVDAYPRESDGLLASLVEEKVRMLELFMLRNLVDYPIIMQLKLSRVPLLSDHTRANVRLVIDTMKKIVPDVPFQPYLDCPPSFESSSNVQHVNISDIPTQLLWACEVKRLESLVRKAAEAGVRDVGSEYDVHTLNWMRSGLPSFLGIRVISGQELDNAANAAFEAVHTKMSGGMWS